MKIVDLYKEAGSVSYPGRGIVAGLTADGKYAVYFDDLHLLQEFHYDAGKGHQLGASVWWTHSK